MLQNFEKSSYKYVMSMAKNEEKPSTCLQPTCRLIPDYPKIRFQVPVLPLLASILMLLELFSYTIRWRSNMAGYKKA